MSPGQPQSLSIEVALSLKKPDVLSGASIPASVTLRNTSAAVGVLVQSPEAECPFTFHFESEKGESFDISEHLFEQQTQPQPAPPREVEMAPLPAGSSLE